MTPEDKFGLNRLAAETVERLDRLLDVSPYALDRQAARVWFWQTLSRAIADRLDRADRERD